MTESLKSAAQAVKDTISYGKPAPASNQYLHWDAPGVEEIKPDEESKQHEIANIMNQMQQKNFEKHRRAFTATHVKLQGVVKGTLTVKSDLPKHLQHGMFVVPGKKFDVIARYANEPYLLQSDQERGPRGLSMKVFGVSGTKLDDSTNEHGTQDWFFNNAPMIELTDLDTTLEIMKLRLENFDSPNMLGAKLTLRTDALKQHAPYQLPNTNLISHSFYTQSAFRFGEYYGHLGLFPVLDQQATEEAKQSVKSSDPETALSDWLREYFRTHSARYAFRIQLGTSAVHHPTEDASVVWDEATAPYQDIAIVEFPPQDSFSHQRRLFWDMKLKLSPWSGLLEHQPLGSVNRLRKYVYARSAKKRDEINVGSSQNVLDIGEIPD